MGRKKQIFLQLYTKDYTGDERLRMCSPSAWGVYSYLLCLLNSTTIRGAYKLSLLERRPDLKKSLTQRVLSATSESAKIPPFAEILQRQMPWKKTEILRALKELLFYHVITIEDDALIQPRMYREGGNVLKSELLKNSDDSEFSEYSESSEKKPEKSAEKGTENDSQKNDIPARTIACARSENMSYNNINNDNNNPINNNITKGEKSKKEKSANFIPPTLEEVKAYFTERNTTINAEAFWAHYEANGWVQSRGKPIRNWKACLTTWEHRKGDFGDGNVHNKQNGAVKQTKGKVYDDW